MTTRELFARLIKCEAGGEGESGMRAVASSVMNRVHIAYGEYFRTGQGDLRRVIEQMCQYSCVKTTIGGQQNYQNIWTSTPEAVHFRVADWALGGGVHSGITRETIWYMNPFNPDCPNYFPYNRNGYWYTRINQHCYYNPMPSYADT